MSIKKTLSRRRLHRVVSPLSKRPKLSVRRILCDMAGLFQGPLEEGSGLLIVLDHQNAHVLWPPSATITFLRKKVGGAMGGTAPPSGGRTLF